MVRLLKKMERDSNYELLRIVSIIFIVSWHVIQHGHLIENTSGVTNLIFNAVMLFVIVHVNSFMLITGYYQSKSTFKLKKLLSLMLEIWFYNFIISLILKLTGLVSYTNIDFLVKTSFFYINAFWYIKCYIIIYLLSPFLNILISKIDRKIYLKLIIVLLLVFSILPYFTGNLFYFNDGFNVSQYLLLYFIGAYIRKYKLINNFLKTKNITQKRIIYISTFIFCWIFNLAIYYFSSLLLSLDSGIFNFIGSCIVKYKYAYNNPIIILQSLSIFMLFGTFKFKNKIINIIGSFTLGIYLIHENDYLRLNLFKWIGLDTDTVIYGNSIILKALLWIMIIFITCSIIEFLRQRLFKMLSKLKIVNKITNGITNFLHQLFAV